MSLTKKTVSVLLTLCMALGLFLLPVQAAGMAEINEIADTYQEGTVNISGVAYGSSKYVQLYLYDESGALKFYDQIAVSGGQFQRSIVVPLTWTPGEYTAKASYAGVWLTERTFHVADSNTFIGMVDIEAAIDQYETYTLPATATADYTNADQEVPVTWGTWTPALDTHVAGTYVNEGTAMVDGSAESVTLTLTVNAVSVTAVTAPGDMTVEIGDTVYLPQTVSGTLSNGKTAALAVTWTPDPATADTSSEKTLTFSGSVENYATPITVTVAVKAEVLPIPEDGLAIWTKAEAGGYELDDQGRVMTWLDQSGNGNHLVAPGEVNRPTIAQNAVNRQKALDFDGVNNYLTMEYDTPYVGDSTVIIVHKIRETAVSSANPSRAYTGIFNTAPQGATGNDIDTFLISDTTAQFRWNNVQDGRLPKDRSETWFNWDNTSFHSVGLRFVNNYVDGVWQNVDVTKDYDGTLTTTQYGVYQNTPTPLNNHVGFMLNGRVGGGGHRCLNSEVAEVIVYHRALTDEEFTQVENYLDDKYRKENRYTITEQTETPAGEGTVDLSAKLSNLSSTVLKEAVAIPVVYDGQTMVSQGATQVTGLASGASQAIVAEDMAVPADDTNKSVKYYLWDSLEDMHPLLFDTPVPEKSAYVPGTGDQVTITSVVPEGNVITVSGVTPGGADKKLTLLAAVAGQPLGKDSIYYAGEAMSGADGAFTAQFAMPDTAMDGTPLKAEFDLYVGGEEAERSEAASFSFVSESLRQSTIQKINDAAEDKDLAAIFAPDSEDRVALDALGLSMAVQYDALTDAGKQVMRDAVMNGRPYDVNDGTGLAAVFGAAYPYALLLQAEDAAEITEVLDTYASETFGMETVTGKKQEDLTAEEKTAVSEYLLAHMPDYPGDTAAFGQAYQLGYAFCQINSASYVSMATALSDNAALLGLTENSAYTSYLGMSDDGKEYVQTEMVKDAFESPFDTAEEVISSLTSAVNSYDPDDPGTGGGGGGGGSNSGGGGSYHGGGGVLGNGGVNIGTPDPTDPGTNTEFTDLANTPWAQEAIAGLVDCGIVNGKGDGLFAPNDQVTREEFVKMTVEAFGLYDASAACTFADVTEGQWFYPYVASGVASGVIRGISETAFGAGQPITREDLAVMLVRAAGDAIAVEEGSTASFGDSGEISDYAAASVAALQKAGIVRGREDGRFDPKAPCTRAESAVMLYNLLKVVGK